MAKLRYRDKWHLIFCLAWLAFAILPLAPHLPSINLMLVHFPLPLLPSLSHSTDKLPQIQLDAMEMMKFPPQIHYMGTPLYWEYRLSFLEVCRTFVWSDGAELVSNLL